MNKRIQELAEQAKEHADSYDDAGTPIWFQMYNEKFAELIVRESIGLLGSESEYGRNHIKRHFGVEE